MPVARKTPGVLALDLALRCGYAHSGGFGGTYAISSKAVDGSNGARYREFMDWLAVTCRRQSTKLIVYESGSHKRGGAAARMAFGLAAVVDLYCHDRGVRLATLNTVTIKKHATGRGNARKGDMILAARKRFPSVKMVDDNHVDALWILDLALKTLEW